MEQHEKAIALVNEFLNNEKILNEADTRNRIIDTVLYDILSWPKNAVSYEEHIHTTGYADYILKDNKGDYRLIIEAKKEGISFAVPSCIDNSKYSQFIKIKTLLTDKEIAKTITQVRNYALQTGTHFAAITNGHIWIFFQVFTQNWRNTDGFVISDLRYFSDEFIDAHNKFSYNSILKQNSLLHLLNSLFPRSKKMYSVKTSIPSFTVPVDLNEYAQYLSKPINRYFGDFNNDDEDFFQKCYIDDGHLGNTKQTLTSLFNDCVTPYMENNGVTNQHRDKLSRKLTKKISNFITYGDSKNIVVIYGDRGCGKSTFITKLINYDISETTKNKLRIIHLNLLEYAPTENYLEKLKDNIWSKVLKEIDIDCLLDDYDAIQNILFKDVFLIYKKQLSTLFDINSTEYAVRIEQKIKDVMQDKIEVAKRITMYLREEKKHEVVLILDNTDQFSSEVQDFCFQVLAEIFSAIKCLSMITVREERFFRSKKLGVLDAYETTQYHIASPQADQVFLQRLYYLNEILGDDEAFASIASQQSQMLRKNRTEVTKDNFKKYMNVFTNDFKRKSNLYTFLVSCAQKDMRKSLELFRNLVVSGYMNIREMVSTKNNIFTLQIHQVLKPLMTPNKYFYEENSSSVPNIYQIRYPEAGSHFTAIRILKHLNSNSNDYESLSIMKADFIATFNMEEDFIQNIKLLIEYKLIEADIKVDEFVYEIEKVTITPYGRYFIDKLIHFFTYLDLVCTDSNVYSEDTANYIALSANEEYKLFISNKKIDRLKKRIQKTNAFMHYLLKEEEKEKELFNLKGTDLVIKDIVEEYFSDIKNVHKSASRQNYGSVAEYEDLDNFFKFLRKKPE